MAGYFRGTSNEEDYRFVKTKKAVQTLPSEFSLVVDVTKVNKASLMSYVSTQLEKILGIKDEIVESLVVDFLDEKNSVFNPVSICETVQGFSNAADAMSFTCSLMRFLHSESMKEQAPTAPNIVPRSSIVPPVSIQPGSQAIFNRSKESRDGSRGFSRKSRSRSRSPGDRNRTGSASRPHRRPSSSSSRSRNPQRPKSDDRFKDDEE
jgi:PWI domain